MESRFVDGLRLPKVNKVSAETTEPKVHNDALHFEDTGVSQRKKPSAITKSSDEEAKDTILKVNHDESEKSESLGSSSSESTVRNIEVPEEE